MLINTLAFVQVVIQREIRRITSPNGNENENESMMEDHMLLQKRKEIFLLLGEKKQQNKRISNLTFGCGIRRSAW